ncbi:glycosyltransferase family 4 protein [Phenylobacterium sp.]|uniref:glycosyltransferase family 4 protein n=1 Tax=Phenylobacterium sp. TaxID=1871053 RepID=UPI00273106B7|nr:glycosyltransferase family 4 protein [Phenylobacterium sp.]MDP2215351.1 glycosyltransferase family 4 protein [Phenylobacterium sp.]
MTLVGRLREVWRDLAPEDLRRRAQPLLAPLLEAHVRRQARRPHGADGAAGGPLRIVGYFSGSHGIAASAQLAARAFAALGVPVEQVDVAGAALTWSPSGPPPTPASAWIFHLNPPELLAALGQMGPARLVGPRYGYWAWELPRAPAAWLKDGALVDEIWAPSRYVGRALAGARAPVRVVPHPLFLEDYDSVRPAPRGADFQAVSLFDFNSSAARKNPAGAITAFARAFGDDGSAKLVLKTQNGGRFPAALNALRTGAPANVEIIDGVWPYEQVKALIAGSDVLISLHRAEGFGLTPAEALALGTPVLATDWSGVKDFLDSEVAVMIPAGRAPVEDPQGIYAGQSWAEPDLDQAAAGLAALRSDPQRRAVLAAAGRRRVAERLSPQAWFTTLPDAVKAAAMRAAQGR